MLGTRSDAAELLDELVVRAGADPTSAFLAHMPYREAKRYLAGLGDAMAGDDDRLGEAPWGGPVDQGLTFSKSEFFRNALPAQALTALVENLEGEGSSASRASWTSRRGAGLTTACRQMPPPSPIATNFSCSSTWSS